MHTGCYEKVDNETMKITSHENLKHNYDLCEMGCGMSDDDNDQRAQNFTFETYYNPKKLVTLCKAKIKSPLDIIQSAGKLFSIHWCRNKHV